MFCLFRGYVSAFSWRREEPGGLTRSRDHTKSIGGHGRSASRHRAAPGDPSTAMSNSPRDWALPPRCASRMANSAKNSLRLGKGFDAACAQTVGKRERTRFSTKYPVRLGNTFDARGRQASKVLPNRPKNSQRTSPGGSRPASGERPRPQHTKRRRTREGGPPPTTRASAACDYPPRYAFRTSSSTSSSAPVPDFLIVPISST